MRHIMDGRTDKIGETPPNYARGWAPCGTHPHRSPSLRLVTPGCSSNLGSTHRLYEAGAATLPGNGNPKRGPVCPDSRPADVMAASLAAHAALPMVRRQ